MSIVDMKIQNVAFNLHESIEIWIEGAWCKKGGRGKRNKCFFLWDIFMQKPHILAGYFSPLEHKYTSEIHT